MVFNLKRTMGVGLIAISLAFMTFAFAPIAQAEANSTQSAQIQELLEMIKKLQAQIAQMQGKSSSSVSTCLNLSRSLYLGVSDSESAGEVTKLQQFLTNTGHYTYGKATGYYGPATQQAVQAWQAEKKLVSSGSPETTGFGMVGPSTRSEMARGCVSISKPVEVDKEKDLEFLVDPVVISNIQAKASDDGVVYSGEKAYVYGTGLKGGLTIKLGNIEPKYIKINSTSDKYVEFTVPKYSQTIDLSVRVTNSSGEASSPFSIKVEVASTQNNDEEETDSNVSYSVELNGENQIDGHRNTYEISPTSWQKISLDVTNYTLIKECRLVTKYDDGEDKRDEQLVIKANSNKYSVPTSMTLLGNFSYITSSRVDCTYYNNIRKVDEIKFGTEDSDEEESYSISFDGVNIKTGTVTKHKAFSECEKEYENSRTLQSSVVVKCNWDDSLFFEGGGKG